MPCPLCDQRKARRDCPALGRQICAVCCGTKRLVEIRCTPDCTYLVSARAHPPAVVQRQQHRDRDALVPVVQGLSDRQARLFVLMATLVTQHRAEALQKLADEDVAQAAEALAATLETADRGIVYEHHPASLPAQRLLTDLKTRLEEVSREGGSSALDRDAAAVLRRLERGAKETRVVLDGGDTAFQQLLARVITPASSEAAPSAAAGGTGAPAGPVLVTP
jgi:hypothetical protein